jgi:hypothetical protein
MTVSTLGSGLGGFAAVAPQPTYGASFVTPTRSVTFKTGKSTWNPHIVDGGPYLLYGQLLSPGSTHIQTWLDATGTLTGDVVTTGQAALTAWAFASNKTLQQIGTTTAYALGGLSGVSLSNADANVGAGSAACLDMQYGVPMTNAQLNPVNFHSCLCTKAEWMFDRAGLVGYSYDFDAQTVESQTALITPTVNDSPVAFAMNNTNCVFKLGPYGSEITIDGVRKATVTLERKYDTNRIYLGNALKEQPITNDYVDFTVSMDVDNTSTAYADVFGTWLTNTPVSIIIESVGAQIGTSGFNNTFALFITDAFIMTGGETSLDGPDLVKNTVSFKGFIDVNGDPAMKALLITSDSTF